MIRDVGLVGVDVDPSSSSSTTHFTWVSWLINGVSDALPDGHGRVPYPSHGLCHDPMIYSGRRNKFSSMNWTLFLQQLLPVLRVTSVV